MHRPGQYRLPQEVAQVVGQHEQLQPHLVVYKVVTGQASWPKVWCGGGCKFSATERAHKRNEGQVDAEYRRSSLIAEEYQAQRPWVLARQGTVLLFI